jgi:hypothetical protein
MLRFMRLVTVIAALAACRQQAVSVDASELVEQPPSGGPHVDRLSLPVTSQADAEARPPRAGGSPDGSAAAILTGRFVGRGVWGVHNTGTLRIRIRDGGCDARYSAEGSYFCGTSHRLTCSLAGDGSTASIVETSCVRSCLDGHGPETSGCYGEAFGIHGTLTRDAEGHAVFRLADRVVKARSKYSTLTSIDMRVEEAR